MGETLLIPTGDAARKLNGLASINETGKYILDRLKEKTKLADLYAAFAREYELTEGEAEADVNEFLQLALTRDVIVKY